MSNVTELPDSMQRQWRVVEAGLRASLTTGETEPGAIEAALAALKPVFLKWTQPRESFTGPPDEAVAFLDHWAYTIMVGLMLELVNLEVELWRAGLRG